MERINNLSDDELLNLGKLTANAMIDEMIALKNKNYSAECITKRITECDINGDSNLWVQFQIKMQTNPMLFIQDEIEFGLIPSEIKRQINLEIFDASLQILNLCEMNDIPIQIANIIINKFESTINNLINK